MPFYYAENFTANLRFSGVKTFFFFSRPPEISRTIFNFVWAKTFFPQNNCVWCLGPRPSVFLSLASRGSVLGKSVLGLCLGFFMSLVSSSFVARGEGAMAPSIGLSTKMQNKENTSFLALLRLFRCTGMTYKVN